MLTTSIIVLCWSFCCSYLINEFWMLYCDPVALSCCLEQLPNWDRACVYSGEQQKPEARICGMSNGIMHSILMPCDAITSLRWRDEIITVHCMHNCIFRTALSARHADHHRNPIHFWCHSCAVGFSALRVDLCGRVMVVLLVVLACPHIWRSQTHTHTHAQRWVWVPAHMWTKVEYLSYYGRGGEKERLLVCSCVLCTFRPS